MTQNYVESRKALSVSDFIAQVNASLSAHGGRIEGEVTSVKKTYQTAIYFSIQDLKQNALLNCVMWRTVYNQNGVDIKEGDNIIVTGVPEIYAARGSFTLKVQTIEYAGEGALKKSYDELKEKLTVEGLLRIDRKRSLPDYPKKIGVITSRSGVVIQDFNSNLGRYGFMTTMVDSRVEGKDAIHEILAALKTMAKQDIEVLVIMRGGGSWESLQAFNTESVVRAISGFKCPVLTGIGHDVDVTLAELVADVGVSTPTAVAEALNETWDTLIGSIDATESKIFNSYERQLSSIVRLVDMQSSSLFRTYEQILATSRNRLHDYSSNIRTYYRKIERIVTQVSILFQQVVGVMRSEIKSIHSTISAVQNNLPRQLRASVDTARREVEFVAKHVTTEQKKIIQTVSNSLIGVEKNIKLSDPSRNLRLGYSLSYINGKLVRSIKEIAIGNLTETRLADGGFTSEIKNVK